MFFLFFVIQVMLCVTTIMAIVRSCALINFKVCMQCSYMYMKKKKERKWMMNHRTTHMSTSLHCIPSEIRRQLI